MKYFRINFNNGEEVAFISGGCNRILNITEKYSVKYHIITIPFAPQARVDTHNRINPVAEMTIEGRINTMTKIVLELIYSKQLSDNYKDAVVQYSSDEINWDSYFTGKIQTLNIKWEGKSFEHPWKFKIVIVGTYQYNVGNGGNGMVA